MKGEKKIKPSLKSEVAMTFYEISKNQLRSAIDLRRRCACPL